MDTDDTITAEDCYKRAAALLDSRTLTDEVLNAAEIWRRLGDSALAAKLGVVR